MGIILTAHFTTFPFYQLSNITSYQILPVICLWAMNEINSFLVFLPHENSEVLYDLMEREFTCLWLYKDRYRVITQGVKISIPSLQKKKKNHLF